MGGAVVLKHNVQYATRYLRNVSRQVAFARAVALSKTVLHIKSDEVTAMTEVFDRPTPWVLNSVKTRMATISKPEASVFIKTWGNKGASPAEVLTPQVEGGGRGFKAFEGALLAGGFIYPGDYVVPAAGAKLDSYGNPSRGQIVQIMSQLRVQRSSGFDSFASNSAASRRSRRRQGVAYFALRWRRGKLKPGIYMRKDFAHGSAVKPVFLFVGTPVYQSRFKFFEIAQRSAERYFPIYYQEAMTHALKTAR